MKMTIALLTKRPLLSGSPVHSVSTLRTFLHAFLLIDGLVESSTMREGKGGAYECCRHHYLRHTIQ